MISILFAPQLADSELWNLSASIPLPYSSYSSMLKENISVSEENANVA